MVAFVFQKLAAECQSAGYSGTLIPYKCDLSNEEEILSMFSAIKTLHKGVDVCINNAGLAHNEPLLSGKTEGWRNMLDVSEYRQNRNAKAKTCWEKDFSGCSFFKKTKQKKQREELKWLSDMNGSLVLVELVSFQETRVEAK